MIRRLKDHISRECSKRVTNPQPLRSPTEEGPLEATEAVVSTEEEVITMVSSEDVASTEDEVLQEAKEEQDQTEPGEEEHHIVAAEEDITIIGKSKLNISPQKRRSVMDQSHLPKTKLHSSMRESPRIKID